MAPGAGAEALASAEGPVVMQPLGEASSSSSNRVLGLVSDSRLGAAWLTRDEAGMVGGGVAVMGGAGDEKGMAALAPCLPDACKVQSDLLVTTSSNIGPVSPLKLRSTGCTAMLWHIDKRDQKP